MGSSEEISYYVWKIREYQIPFNYWLFCRKILSSRDCKFHIFTFSFALQIFLTDMDFIGRAKFLQEKFHSVQSQIARNQLLLLRFWPCALQIISHLSKLQGILLSVFTAGNFSVEFGRLSKAVLDAWPCPHGSFSMPEQCSTGSVNVINLVIPKHFTVLEILLHQMKFWSLIKSNPFI